MTVEIPVLTAASAVPGRRLHSAQNIFLSDTWIFTFPNVYTCENRKASDRDFHLSAEDLKQERAHSGENSDDEALFTAAGGKKTQENEEEKRS